MKNFNLIILAGGKRKDWPQQYTCTMKAHLPIAGKPMLDWVIEAFHKSNIFKNIIVVGTKQLDNLNSMQYIKKRLAQGSSLLQNLVHAVLYIKFFIYKMAKSHQGYVISFCDAPLLTPRIIKNTLHNIDQSEADIVMHYVEKSTLIKAGLPSKDRSYMTIGGKEYTGTNIYYIRKSSLLLKCLPYIGRIRKVRKEPNKILELLGCTGKTFPEIEIILSSLLKAKVRIFTSPHPEMGIDVDKPQDYELINQLLAPNIPMPKKADENPALVKKTTHKSYLGFVKLACWLLMIAAFGILGQKLGVKQMYLQSLDWIKDFHIFAPFLFLGLYLLLAGLFLPALILKISAGFLFGMTQGIILVTIASTISSIIKFLLARHWCRESVAKRIKTNPQWQAIDQLIEEKGWKILLLLRNIPIVSSMFLNYICGLSSMRLKDFIYASSIGRLPSTILYVYLGCLTGNMINIQNRSIERMIVEWTLFAVGIIAFIIFIFYCRRVLKNKTLNYSIPIS